MSANHNRIVFICLGNSCRSIMAEALTRHFFAGRVQAASVGLQPLGWVVPATLQVLAEMGVATAGLYSKGLEELDLATYAVIVNLTRQDLASLNAIYGSRVRHRPIPDPFGGSLEVYRQTRDEITRLLLRELPDWLGL